MKFNCSYAGILTVIRRLCLVHSFSSSLVLRSPFLPAHSSFPVTLSNMAERAESPHSSSPTSTQQSTDKAFTTEHVERIRTNERVPGHTNYYEKDGLRTYGDDEGMNLSRLPDQANSADPFPQTMITSLQ